jgi:hypothetical protein
MESKFTSADEIKADEWESITTIATGRTYGIRRVWPFELVRDGILSIPQAKLVEIRDKATAGDELDQFEKEQVRLFQNALICRGVASLKVLDCEQKLCPPGFVSVDSLAVDRDELFFAISRKSNFGIEQMKAHASGVNVAPREGDEFRGDRSAEDAPGAPAEERSAH